MGPDHREWLLTDGRGGFAMGTPEGIRWRKYHGFYLTLPGRSQAHYLSDLEIQCNGTSLWPHGYRGKSNSPEIQSTYEQGTYGPSWSWVLPQGKLIFQLSAGEEGGIRLGWKWVAGKENSADRQARPRGLPRGFPYAWGAGEAKRSPPKAGVQAPAVEAWLCKDGEREASRSSQARNLPGGQISDLSVRFFCGMRDLHSLGGVSWSCPDWKGSVAEIQAGSMIFYGRPQGDWTWQEDPVWYRDFYYPEEEKRGYASEENLFSAGRFKILLRDECGWHVSENVESFSHPFRSRLVRPELDFCLEHPSGVAAGYPWFGEWGRDTFISLPGLFIARVQEGDDLSEVSNWALEVLKRWGTWIPKQGMLPNFLSPSGDHSWESADATLWWSHALASLWSFSLAFQDRGSLKFSLQREFQLQLKECLKLIRNGKHPHLRENREGLLEVLTPRSTWMDAKVDGLPVVPRAGVLPEINALWFQANCLEEVWESKRSSSLLELGHQVMKCKEEGRPHRIFLHSLPLAPSWFLDAGKELSRDLDEISEKFWTPWGLRTLDPQSPAYQPRCVGAQRDRDLSYHQGPVWAWLAGHFEMAKNRAPTFKARGPFFPETKDLPIPRHLPELFDAEAPFTPRGTPSQAWSFACWAEARERARLGIDSRLRRIWVANGEQGKKREK